jgi:dUTPase
MEVIHSHLKIDASVIKTETASNEAPKRPPMPFETHGFGSFEPYSKWSAPSMVVNGNLQHTTMHSPGFALTAISGGTITAKSNKIFQTNVIVAVPFGHFGKLEAVDCLLAKHILPFSQIIESNSSTPIAVSLINHSELDYTITQGDTIAQLILQRYVIPQILKKI